MLDALASAARVAEITAIVPVGHGAAGVLTDGDHPVIALDYEAEPPAPIAAAYEERRDPFEATLSPRLPQGLNLGLQLFWLERLRPDLWPARGEALLWPQYWAWRLTGERASELTSLGCHSDLWRPAERRFSDLAIDRGWDWRLGPLRGAREIAGEVRPALAAALGLPRRCRVLVGLHDSNAALVAARALAGAASGPFAVVSTGTWFITMASGGTAPPRFDPAEDMFANIDVEGRLVPTARFMGGRDYETWMGEALGAAGDPDRFEEAAALTDWRASPPRLRATRAALELARNTARSLELLGAQGPIVLEGRFARDAAFAAALRRLRPGASLAPAMLVDGVALGALSLALGEGRDAPAVRA